MSTALFRAIDANAGSDIAMAHVRPIRSAALTTFLALSVLAAGAYAATASYSRKQVAIGYLAPDHGIVRLAPPRSGSLATLFVADGQHIAEGDPLFSLDFHHSLESGESVDDVVRAALAREEALLHEQLASEATRAANDQARLASKIAGLETELRAMAGQRLLLEQRSNVAHGRMTSVTDLRQRGLISENDYRAREDVWLAHRQEMAALDQRIVAAVHDLQQARLQRDALPIESADRLARLRGSIADLRQRAVQAQAQGAQLIRAPVAGRVTAVQAAVGQRVDPARPVLAIIPDGTAMRAELFVPSRAIGFVRPGQTVRLMYDAFPFQRFGSYQGTVDTVSATVLAPDEVNAPVHPQEPSYRIAVRLARPTVAAFGRDVALQPDMTVSADIMLEQRTLLEWLLEPLLIAKGRM